MAYLFTFKMAFFFHAKVLHFNIVELIFFSFVACFALCTWHLSNPFPLLRHTDSLKYALLTTQKILHATV